MHPVVHGEGGLEGRAQAACRKRLRHAPPGAPLLQHCRCRAGSPARCCTAAPCLSPAAAPRAAALDAPLPHPTILSPAQPPPSPHPWLQLFYPDEEDPIFPPSVQQRLRDVLVKEVRRVDTVSHPGLPKLLQNIEVRRVGRQLMGAWQRWASAAQRAGALLRQPVARPGAETRRAGRGREGGESLNRAAAPCRRAGRVGC